MRNESAIKLGFGPKSSGGSGGTLWDDLHAALVKGWHDAASPGTPRASARQGLEFWHRDEIIWDTEITWSKWGLAARRARLQYLA
jgi:hypothetical protein